MSTVGDWLSSLFGDGDKTLIINALNAKSSGKRTKIVAKRGSQVNIIKIDGPLNKEILKELEPLAKAYQRKEVMFLADDAKATVDKALQFEGNPHVKSLLNFFKDKLPLKDFQLLRTGLYMRHLTEQGEVEQVGRLTESMAGSSSERDRRIVNLASAGYYNTYFRPLYKQLSVKTNGHELFLDEYTNVLDNMTFAIFVHPKMREQELTTKVIERAVKNIRYGVRTETITLHAMGGNVKTVESALPAITAKFSRVKIKRPAKSLPVIRVIIYYTENSLTPDDFDSTT